MRTLRIGGALVGRRVLITGAAGGVGTLAVQIAARSGAHVTAVVGRAERAAGLLALGAAEVVEGIDQAQGRFALILESAGGASLAVSGTRGSSLNPKGTEGSVNPVIESNGTINRSGLREKLRLTSNASWVTARSQNSCCRMIDISSGKRCLTAGGTTTPGAWVLNAMLKWCSPMSPLRAVSARTLRTTERSASCTRRS